MGGGEASLAFPTWLLTFPLCIISPESIAPASGPSCGPAAWGNVTVQLSTLTRALLVELRRRYVFMNKTHLPLQTRLLGGISKTHNMLVSARAVPVSPVRLVPVKPH